MVFVFSHFIAFSDSFLKREKKNIMALSRNIGFMKNQGQKN